MNYRMGGSYSVLLMSVRINAPYRDRIEDEGLTLIYEGHDVPKSGEIRDPKSVDQPELTPKGSLTENGKFHRAAQEYKRGKREPEVVRVYEKIRPGIWSYNGLFALVDSWKENDGRRKVFMFKLVSVEDTSSQQTNRLQERRRQIPTSVKQEVWKRDKGRCVVCGATDELHFDHIIPFSKGGTSLSADNIQLLCARHNIQKKDKIQ